MLHDPSLDKDCKPENDPAFDLDVEARLLAVTMDDSLISSFDVIFDRCFETSYLPRGLLDAEKSDDKNSASELATLLDFIESTSSGLLQSINSSMSEQSRTDTLLSQSSIEDRQVLNGLCNQGSCNMKSSSPLIHELKQNRSAGLQKPIQVLNDFTSLSSGRHRVHSDFWDWHDDSKGNISCSQEAIATEDQRGLFSRSNELLAVFRTQSVISASNAHSPSLKTQYPSYQEPLFELHEGSKLMEQAVDIDRGLTYHPRMREPASPKCLTFCGKTEDASSPFGTSVSKAPVLLSRLSKLPRGADPLFRVEWSIGEINKVLKEKSAEISIVSPQFATATNLANVWLMLTVSSKNTSDGQNDIGLTGGRHSPQLSIKFTTTSQTTVQFGIECGIFSSAVQSHCFDTSPWSPATIVGPNVKFDNNELKIAVEFYDITLEGSAIKSPDSCVKSRQRSTSACALAETVESPDATRTRSNNLYGSLSIRSKPIHQEFRNSNGDSRWKIR